MSTCKPNVFQKSCAPYSQISHLKYNCCILAILLTEILSTEIQYLGRNKLMGDTLHKIVFMMMNVNLNNYNILKPFNVNTKFNVVS